MRDVVEEVERGSEGKEEDEFERGVVELVVRGRPGGVGIN
jgi:hypothetical protein